MDPLLSSFWDGAREAPRYHDRTQRFVLGFFLDFEAVVIVHNKER